MDHLISEDGVRPNADRVATLSCISMATYTKKLRSLPGGLSDYRMFIPIMTLRIRSITTLVKKGAVIYFIFTMKDTVHALFTELPTPPILVFLDCDALTDKSRP